MDLAEKLVLDYLNKNWEDIRRYLVIKAHYQTALPYGNLKP